MLRALISRFCSSPMAWGVYARASATRFQTSHLRDSRFQRLRADPVLEPGAGSQRHSIDLRTSRTCADVWERDPRPAAYRAAVAVKSACAGRRSSFANASNGAAKIPSSGSSYGAYWRSLYPSRRSLPIHSPGSRRLCSSS